MKPWLTNEINHFNSQIMADRLPHALIIAGVKGSGKQALSQWLAKSLLCIQVSNSEKEKFNQSSNQLLPCQQCKNCALFDAHTHPDFFALEEANTSIGIEQVRSVSRFLEKTAQLGANQVVIINNAAQMTEPAANALLKTLEEPTSNSYIILLVDEVQKLLPTIVSRCLITKIKPFTGESLLASIGNTNQGEFTNLSHLPELTEPLLAEQYQLFNENFIKFLFPPYHQTHLLKQLLESNYALNWLEKITVNLLRSQYQWCDVENMSHTVSKSELIDFLQHNQNKLQKIYLLINKTNKQLTLTSQINRELCLEKLIADIRLILMGEGIFKWKVCF